MGCFSWMYADTNNEEPLNIGCEAFLLLPNESHIYESSYDGYGRFGGKDVFDLVVDWNRDYVAANPEHVTYHGSMFKDYPWYPVLCDKTVETKDIIEECKRRGIYPDNTFKKLRDIGIDIACWDEDNAAIAYPIKILKKDPRKMPTINYWDLPASNSDPNQGFGADW